MSDPVFGDKKVKFPVEVHFRIVSQASPEVDERVRAAADSLGVADKLTAGNASSSGKYLSYQLSVVVESEERITSIDQTFRAVDGVRMVL